MERAETGCAVMGAGDASADAEHRHGTRSRDPRPYDERAAEIEAELLALPHIGGIDAPACREISKLMSLIERVDVALSGRAGREVRSRPPSDRHVPLLVARVAGVAARGSAEPLGACDLDAHAGGAPAGSPVPRQTTPRLE